MVASLTELRPAFDLAVRRDVVARPDPDAIAGLQLADGDLTFAAVLFEQVGAGRGQTDQGLDGGPGAQGGARLDQLAEQHEEADQPRRHVLAHGKGRHDAERRQFVHVRLTPDQTGDRVDDDRSAEEDGSEHREQLRVEAALPVEELAEAAVDQKDAAGQGAEQRDADPQLLAAGLFGRHVMFEMQMFVSHR